MTNQDEGGASLQAPAAHSDGDRREAMLIRRDEVHAKHPEVTTALEFAPLMGDLAGEYMLWQLERLKRQVDDTGLPLAEAFDLIRDQRDNRSADAVRPER